MEGHDEDDDDEGDDDATNIHPKSRERPASHRPEYLRRRTHARNGQWRHPGRSPHLRSIAHFW